MTALSAWLIIYGVCCSRILRLDHEAMAKLLNHGIEIQVAYELS